MFDSLKIKILSYRIGNKRLVCLNGERKTFKTVLSSSEKFADTDIGHDIIDATSYLPPTCDIPFRLKCIFSNISEVPKCPICGKDCLPLDSNLSVKNKCFSKTCENSVCRAKHSASFIVMTDEIREAHSKAQANHKRRIRLKYQNLVKTYFDGKFKICGKSLIADFYNERVSKRHLNGKLIREMDFDNNVDMLCSILFYSSIIIPVVIDVKSDSIDMSEFKFNERMYCIANELSSLPVCKYCQAKNVKFNNIRDGYAESCPDCQADKCREKKGLKTKAQIMSDIDGAKYEIVNFPKRVGVDKLTIRCRKCGYISNWKSGSGMLQILHNKKLCKNCEIFDSEAERELAEYVMSIYNGRILRNDRQVISPQELDIVASDVKLAVELDGFYYHSDEKIKPGYHVFKTQRCENVGYQLIHVFENEWAFRRDAVKSEIRYAFGLERSALNGSNVCFRKISECDYIEFFKLNSMGFDIRPSNCLFCGLFENEVMLASAAISNRFRRDYDIHAISVLNGYDRAIVSAKLVDELVYTANPHKIKIFADRRLIEPAYFMDMGFKHSYNTKIRGWWFSSGNFRHDFDMTFDDGSSEMLSDMHTAGYRRIFDCGSAVFVKKFR